MITSATIADWMDLQNQTCRILTECGIEAQTDYRLRHVRGENDIDVFATETIDGRRSTILCECKHWKTNVSKEKVDAFRTVMNDSGAHIGYIISSTNFQSGARRAAMNTNIHLVTWEEFQDRYEQTWYKNFFRKSLEIELLDFRNYSDPYATQSWTEFLSREDKVTFERLVNDHAGLGYLAVVINGEGDNIGFVQPPYLPMREFCKEQYWGLDTTYFPPNVLDASDLRSLYDAILTAGKKAEAQFRVLRERARNESKRRGGSLR